MERLQVLAICLGSMIGSLSVYVPVLIVELVQYKKLIQREKEQKKQQKEI